MGYSERLVLALVTSFVLEADDLGRERSPLVLASCGLDLVMHLTAELVSFEASLRSLNLAAGQKLVLLACLSLVLHPLHLL